MATDLYKTLFKQALRIRMVEEMIIKHYPSDKIQSPVHLSIGQEAVAVGLCYALKQSDILYSTYRSHAFYLAKGGNLNAMMAELFGRVDGCCKGKGGSMHLADPEVNFMGTSAIVGSSISHAVGSALAAKLQGTKQLTLSIFGDGATEEGVYHESLNYASLHQLPIVFICENNQYAIHSKIVDRQSFNIRDHAESYGIKTYYIEQGYDLDIVYQSCNEIINKARLEQKPCFIEILTSRYKEHVGIGDDFSGGFRDAAEVRHWQALDPLIQDVELIELFKKELNEEIEASIAFAEKSPLPKTSDLHQHVY